MRSASGVCSRAELVEQRAEADLRRHLRLDRDRKLGRAPRLRRLQPARPPWRERHAVEEGLQLCRAGVAGPRTCPIRGPARMFIALRKVSICAGVISPAWLSLWPANGRPKPLMV